MCHTVGALYVGSGLAYLELLHVSHAEDHFLRLLAERNERALLLWVFLWCFFVRVILELMNQFLDCLFADSPDFMITTFSIHIAGKVL